MENTLLAVTDPVVPRPSCLVIAAVFPPAGVQRLANQLSRCQPPAGEAIGDNAVVTTDLPIRDIRHVVVDTNILWGDLHLSGSGWRRLALLQRENFISLHVPEVVVREMVRHFGRRHREDLNKAIEAITTASQLRRALTDLGVELTEVDKRSLRQRRDAALADGTYARELRGQLMSIDASVVELPQVHTVDLLDSYIEERKPFKSNDQGIADYLIWQSIRSLISALNVPVVFLTTNAKDFADKGRLHPELAASLEPGAQVALCESLDAFFFDHQHNFTLIEAREDFGYSEQSDALALSAARAYAEGELVGTEIYAPGGAGSTYGMGIEGLQLPAQIEGLTISWIDIRDESAEWQPYEVFNDTTELGVIDCEAELTAVGYVHRSDAYIIEDPRITVAHFDAEDHYVEVELNIAIQMRLNVQVERGTDGEVVHLDRIVAP